ncbi:hypothetical protein BC835DRAFT_1308835 [Cytidiella melzeri]|nr:hypothetical protein BC835DRAFT_1308835 [Cytidiella melzeri]
MPQKTIGEQTFLSLQLKERYVHAKNAITYARPLSMKTPVESVIILHHNNPPAGEPEPSQADGECPQPPGKRCFPRIPLTISSLIMSVTQEQMDDRGAVEADGEKGGKRGETNQAAATDPAPSGPGNEIKSLLAKIRALLKQALPAHVDVFLTHLYGRPTWSIHRSPMRKLAPGTRCTLQSPNNRYHEYKITGQTGTRENRLILSAIPKRGGKSAFIIVDADDYSPAPVLARLKSKIHQLLRIQGKNVTQDANATSELGERNVRETTTHTWSE